MIDDVDGFLGLSVKTRGSIAQQPWMKKVTLEVIYEDLIPGVVDRCIEAGFYGLDTEATGLDTRVYNGETQDKIVGICLAPDVDHGYYIPLRHQKGRNVSWSFMVEQYRRLRASKSVAVMHGAKYDQEILEYDPGMVGRGVRNFDSISTWEDTLLLALLDDSKAKQRGLKVLSETILQRKMIELEELFPPGKKGLNFSELDPGDPAIGWYAAADAVNTLMLYLYYKPRVFDQLPRQGAVYQIEKACLLAVRWMQRNRIKIDLNRVQQLIQLGQDEAFDSLSEVYEGASQILGRDVTPAYFRHLQQHFVRGDPKQTFSDQVDMALRAVKFWDQQEKLLKIRDAAGREFPERYDIMSPVQLGQMFEEMKVPGLRYTEKSKQVSTKAKDMDELLEEMGERMPFLIKVKKFRNVQKAIGTYLVHLWDDTDRRDSTIRVQFKQDGTDTGRFSTPGERDKADCKRNGTTKFNLHSLPQAGKKGVPDCLAKIREVVVAEDDEFIVSIDFSGVELRIITNLSREPLWIAEFFRCDGCGKKFDQGDGTATPKAPPKYCPDCGSDKIGDLHTLTGISIYGADAKNQKDWKQKRGAAKCVHPDTLIYSPGGLVKVGSLPLGDEDTFHPVDAETHGLKGRVKVLETYNGGVKDLYHVVTRRGIVTCSDQHQFLCADGVLRSISSGLSVGTILPRNPPPVLPLDALDALASNLNTLDAISGDSLKDWITAGQMSAIILASGLCPNITMDGDGLSGLRISVGDFGAPHTLLAIIPAGQRPCMDIHVDSPDHLYWTNGLVTHNSVNFALSYGGGPSAVQRAANVDKEESYRIKDKFDQAYTTLQGWWKAQKAFVRKHHYVLTPFGRKCPLPDITNPDSKISSKAERNSTNAPVQGFSADITKLAMGAIYQECLKRGWLDKVRMLITIHDELVFAIKKDLLEEAIDVLYEIMTRHRAIQILKYPVPLTSDVEIGINWAVPWNLFEIRATGRWPADLIPYFKEAQPSVETPAIETETQATPSPDPVIPLVLVLDQQPDRDMASELRNILQSCQSDGGSPVQVRLPDGLVVDTGYRVTGDSFRQAIPSRWTVL